MRLPVIMIGLGAAMAAGAAHAQSVEIKDAVVRVTVIPEARSDIKVEFLSTHPKLPVQVRQVGDKVVVDGGLNRKIRSCEGDGARASGTFASPSVPARSKMSCSSIASSWPPSCAA